MPGKDGTNPLSNDFFSEVVMDTFGTHRHTVQISNFIKENCQKLLLPVMHQSSYTKVINGKEIGITRRIFLRKSMTGFEPSPLKKTEKKIWIKGGLNLGALDC